MKHQYVTATEFKTKCLALLNEVDQRGGTVTVTKRGRPVARLGPLAAKPWDSLKGAWKGKLQIDDDMTPLDWGSLPRSEDPPRPRRGKRK